MIAILSDIHANLEAAEVVMTMRPRRCGRMCRAAARTVAKMPLRLTSITRFQRESP